jgi:hypothetical protein
MSLGKTVIFLLIQLLITGIGYAQEGQITFEDARLDEANNTIQIVYSLKSTNNAAYNIFLYYSNDGGKTFKGPVDKARISGDIVNVVSDNTLSIYWNYYYADDEFTGENLVFRIVAEEAPQVVAKKLMGPKAALYSIVVPGWGDSKVREGGSYGLITAGTWGILAASIILNSSAKQAYINYLNASTVEEADTEFTRADKRNNTSIVLGTIGVVAWGVDVIGVLIKGMKNRKQGLARIGNTELNIAVNQVQGRPTAGLKVRF